MPGPAWLPSNAPPASPVTCWKRASPKLRLITGEADRRADSLSSRRAPAPGRRRASEIFPEGAGSRVINDLKDVR